MKPVKTAVLDGNKWTVMFRVTNYGMALLRDISLKQHHRASCNRYVSREAWAISRADFRILEGRRTVTAGALRVRS